MRGSHWWIGIVLAAFVTVPVAWSDEDQNEPSRGEAQEKDQKAATSPTDDPPMKTTTMPVFVPPNRGSPIARLGGATRSASGDTLPRIEALVPQEAGWTLREDPVLYWYLSKMTDVRIDFVLLRLDPTEPVVETTLPSTKSAGIQRVRLADHGVKLEPGVSYQWLVKLVPRPDDRSYDRIVGGGVERVEASAELAKALGDPEASQAHELAEGGIWYDAVDSLSTQIEADPENRTLWNQRTALFEQVGLPELPLEEGSAPGLERSP
ncbi:DUF928 domain-containing protein [bacterium]|nr:DUF928 domain-containing protein [bacterium]